jgi:hypothetical protein
MANYDRLAALAQRLIDKNGREITVQHFPTGDLADADKPWRPDASDATEQGAKAVFLDYSIKEIDGTNVLMGDQKMYASPLALGEFSPAVGDLVVDGSVTYTIKNVKPLQPGDTMVLYEAQLRA